MGSTDCVLTHGNVQQLQERGVNQIKGSPLGERFDTAQPRRVWRDRSGLRVIYQREEVILALITPRGVRHTLPFALLMFPPISSRSVQSSLWDARGVGTRKTSVGYTHPHDREYLLVVGRVDEYIHALRRTHKLIAINLTRRPCTAVIKSHQRPSAAIKGHQRSSKVIKGHQRWDHGGATVGP